MTIKHCIILWRPAHDHMWGLFACINPTSSLSIQSTYTTLPTPSTSIPCTHTSVGKDMKHWRKKTNQWQLCFNPLQKLLQLTIDRVLIISRWISINFQCLFHLSFPALFLPSHTIKERTFALSFQLMHPQKQPPCYYSFFEHLIFTTIHNRAVWTFLMLSSHFTAILAVV